MDASEIYAKRLNAKEVIFPKENGKLIFPAADGRIKFVGGHHELRTSTLIREHPIRGEGQRDFLGESEGSPPPRPQDSHPDAGEARNDFWWSGEWGPPRQAKNRRRRTREGPEPACVQTTFAAGVAHAGGEG